MELGGLEPPTSWVRFARAEFGLFAGDSSSFPIATGSTICPQSAGDRGSSITWEARSDETRRVTSATETEAVVPAMTDRAKVSLVGKSESHCRQFRIGPAKPGAR
jgi:hypothetical protein